MTESESISILKTISVIEVYMEEEIQNLMKQLDKIRKITKEHISEELCSFLKISCNSDQKEVIRALMELIR